MTTPNHDLTGPCQKRLADAWQAAFGVRKLVSDGAWVWRDDLAMLDEAIAHLTEARRIHLERLNERKDVAA